MARPDKNSSLKPFFDNAAEGVNQLPSFLTSQQENKNNILLQGFEDAVEIVTSAPAKSGVTTGLLNLADISEKDRTALRERDESNQQTLKDYQDRIDKINQLIPQRRQPELKKLYDEIRANTNFNPLTLGDRFKQFRGFFFNDTAAIHRKVANGEVKVSDLRGDDLNNYLIGLIDTADLATLGLITPITAPIRLAIKAAKAGRAKLAQKFLVDAGDDATEEVTSIVIPDYYQSLIGKGSAETKAKVNKALSENPNQAPKAIANFSKDYGMANYKYLLAEIYKRMQDGTLPPDYMLKQAAPGEVAGTGVQGLGTKAAAEVNKKDMELQEIEAYYAANKSKFKNQGVGFFIDELLKNTSVKSIGDKFLFDRFSGYEDIKTPGFKKGTYNTKSVKSNLETLGQKLEKNGIYSSERARSRNNHYILLHSYRHKPEDIDSILADAGAMTKEEFKKANPNLTTNKEITEAYSDYSYNVGQKMVDDEIRMYIDLNEPQNLAKYEAKLNTRDEFNKWVSNEIDEYFFNPNPTEAQATFIQKYKDALSKATGKNYDDPKDFKKALISIYKTDLTHSYPIRSYTRELAGAGAFADMIKVNFSSLNTGQQAAADATIRRSIKKIKTLKKDKDGKYTPESMKVINEVVEEFQRLNQEFGERLLTSYHKINDLETAQVLKTYFPDRVDDDAVTQIIEGFEEGQKVSTKESKPGIVIGSPITIEPSLDDLKTYWADHIRDGELGVKDPKFVGKAGPKRRGPLAGIIGKVAPGTVDFTFFEQGGDVETEQEKQSIISKAASAIGNILIPKAEALPLPKNFLVGSTPDVGKKVETKLELPAPEAPLLEKRYDIYDDTGKKVFQSKSIDDAQQKALRLGDLEGKTFTVKEVDVPVKVKKTKTTKPSTALVPTVTPQTIIGSGNNKLFYSELDSVINQPTLNIKGTNVTSENVSMSAKGWHDWFRSKGVKESELYDSYIRSYLNRKGGFNRDTGQFTNDQKISYEEIKELVDTSPTNYLQTVSYGDATGTLKYGDSGRQTNYIDGSRKERVLWLDSKDIRGDIGSLPEEIRRYEGHGNMRRVDTSPDFNAQNNTLIGEPYVVGWSLTSNRIAKLNNRNITVNIADEIPSDFLQKASSLKAQIKSEIRSIINNNPNVIGNSEELNSLYSRLENTFRPMPATFAELKKSINELIEADAIFQRIGKMEMDDITKASFKELGEAATKRDAALAEINATIDGIDSTDLFPNIPFKDQKDWVDAIIKNDVYHAAKARFSFDDAGNLVVNQSAPSHYAVVPSKAVKAYQGGRGVEVPPDADRRSGKMVAYDMQYGGPNLNDHTGQHFTSNVEETLNKIANMKNSKVEIGKVDMGHAGSGVDTFMIELTPDMLTPYKAYKKDGGLVKKRILYTPIVSLNDLLSPIGVKAW